jgi:WD40 repeat protein
MALSPDGKILAVGSYQKVDLVNPQNKEIVSTITSLPGKVAGLSFSRDGSMIVASSGTPGVGGLAAICRASDGKIIQRFEGHRDVIYDAQLSPDGKLLATCSYDRTTNIWDVATGKVLRTLSGHNGAIYDVTFSPDGSLLATASADETVKIWQVSSGERFDTLGQPEGEQFAVAISPDAKWIVAAGADRQLRLWSLVSVEKPKINPLKHSRTAHNSAVLKVAVSPDGTRIVTASEGRELVLWDAASLTPIHRFEDQTDVPTGLAFAPDGQNFYISRLDGSWNKYSLPPADPQQQVDDEKLASDASGAAESADKTPANATAEQEPNNTVSNPNTVTANSVVTGVIAAPEKSDQPDVDLYRFHAKKGEQIVLEIKASRDKSPLDSKLEVLDNTGAPVPRVKLQAVRSSYYTFRGHNSMDVNDFRMHAAADMELNEYVYANGEVMKLWLLPQGPDSGFLVFPGTGANRFNYFGSTAITHSLNEPIYIVEPHDPADTILPNGLPVYTLYYENDDDSWRKLGTDSRVDFTAPADGDYVARVSDVRGMGGEKFSYELTLRPARPDFEVKVTAKDLEINAGSGKEFTVTANRKDEFDGEIQLDVTGLPRGFHATTPLTVQAGQINAYGAVTADADAPALAADAKPIKLVATAMVTGKKVRKKAVKIGKLKLAERPKVLVHVLPADAGQGSRPVAESGDAPPSITIAPGETIAAVLKVERNNFDGELKFGGALSGRNLPHGVYVDNIGLNGITLLQGESERKIFLTARKWVPEQSRPFHLQTDAEGKQTSWPILLHVRKRSDDSTQPATTVAATPEQN